MIGRAVINRTEQAGTVQITKNPGFQAKALGFYSAGNRGVTVGSFKTQNTHN